MSEPQERLPTAGLPAIITTSNPISNNNETGSVDLNKRLNSRSS